MNPSRAIFIVGEVAFLAATHVFGGPPWTLVAMTAFVALSFTGPEPRSLALAAPSLAWLAVSHATGNRELFFPYALHLAAVAMCRGGERGAVVSLAAGAGVVAAFFGVRCWQQATPRVLAVEFAVAAAIVIGTVLVRTRSPRSVGSDRAFAADVAIVAAATLAAYAGLAL